VVLKRHLTGIGRSRRTSQIDVHQGKGATEQQPGRNALQTLTRGDATQRSLNNYAKQTPMMGGASPDTTGLPMGLQGSSLDQGSPD
jgi:hypothetical protein